MLCTSTVNKTSTPLYSGIMRSAVVAVACGLAVASSSTSAVAAGEQPGSTCTSEHRAVAEAIVARGDRLAIDNNIPFVNVHDQRRPQQQQQQRGSRRRCYRSRYALAEASRRGSGVGPLSCFLAPLVGYSSQGGRGEQQQPGRITPSARRGR